MCKEEDFDFVGDEYHIADQVIVTVQTVCLRMACRGSNMS
jgi:hypothetical protein